MSDAIDELCALLKEAGLTMTLYGKPVTAAEVRSHATANVIERLVDRTCQRCGFDPSAKVAASWTTVIDREVKSGNAHVFNVGASRWAYGKDRTAWEWEFRAVRLLQKIPVARTRRRLTLTRLFSGRQRLFDGDNLQTGLKGCIDAIVREGLLLGDDAKSADIIYQQEPGGRGLRVLLEELG